MGLAFPKGEPLGVTKHRKRVDADAALRECYADVDARDASICWVTGRYTSSGAVDPRVRREHHHLVKRSRDRGLIDKPHNVITVTAEAHKLIEAGWIVVEGKDARKAIFFHWRADVQAHQKPFRIQAKRQFHRERD